ncbi:hypothetical protein U3516DRAFT_757946 [Neocallimastix sp. 'constans']
MATYLGINVILYDQSQIYNEIGFSRFMSTIILPIINEFVNFIFTFPCLPHFHLGLHNSTQTHYIP